ncbi:MAG: ABC transporter permease subunit [Burkholderiales bacterium]
MQKRSIIVAVVVLLAIPLAVQSNYYMRLVNLALVFAILAISLNIVLGYAGQIALGHAGLFGVGAYTAALMTTAQSGLLFWPAFIAAGVVTGIAGLAIGIPTLRLKGHYLALATLGFGEIMRHIFFNWRAVTHGMDGIGNIPPPAVGSFTLQGEARFYYLAAIVLAIVMLMTHRLGRSKYGRMLAAIRDAELAAGTSGVDVHRLKIIAFFVSAVVAGFAGSLYAHLMAFISPDVFVFDVTALVLMMVLIGGIGTTWGPVLGAVVLTFLPELLRVSKAYYQLIYGAGIAVMIIFLPGGLLGLFDRMRGVKGESATQEGASDSPTHGEMAAVISAETQARAPAGSGEILLSIDQLTCRFGGLVAVDEVSMSIERGTIHALIGPNGAGKSTLINLASGVYTPSSGSITFEGSSIGGARPWAIAHRGLVRTFQNLRLFKTLSVEDNVLVGCRAARQANWFDVFFATRRASDEEAELRSRAEAALRFFDLWPLRGRLVRTLPHEQQRLVEIVRALAMQPKLILLDEPAAGMNPAEVGRLIGQILRLRDRGITILLIEHNVPLVMRVADRITVLNYGRKIAEGPPAEIRTHPEVVAAYLGQRMKTRLEQHAAA